MRACVSISLCMFVCVCVCLSCVRLKFLKFLVDSFNEFRVLSVCAQLDDFKAPTPFLSRTRARVHTHTNLFHVCSGKASGVSGLFVEEDTCEYSTV